MGIKVIFLCAGYGTRLERDIRNSPDHRNLLGIAKAMLPIGGQPLISHWIDLLLPQKDIFDGFFIVTNARFYSQFEDLVRKYEQPIKILNDNSTCNEDRMGANASIQFAIKKFSLENNDVLIIGGDTLFYHDFVVEDFAQKYEKHKESSTKCGLVTTYKCKDLETHKYGILEVDEVTGKVKSLIEKPQQHETKSRLACPCFYLLSPSCSAQISNFLESKKDAPLQEKDASGHLIKYLISLSDIFIHNISGRFDVGGLDSYKMCDDYFSAHVA